MHPGRPHSLVFPAARRAHRRYTAAPTRAAGSIVRAALLPIALAVSLVVAMAGHPSSAASTRTLSTFATVHQLAKAYTPDQLETAYDIKPLLSQRIDGTGQTIALIELDRFNTSDIQQFDAENNLPDPTVEEIYAGGQPFRLPNQGETTMDLEWAHALAPGAKILVYYLPSQEATAGSWRAIAAAVDAAVTDGAGTISLSIGVCKPTTGYTVARQAFAQALARGVSVFVSSGDSGAYPGPVRDCGRKLGVPYPASDPSVVAVGGTALLLSPTDLIAQEVAWRLSGGGKGKPLPRPSWQAAPTLGAGKYRYAPDVSFLGDPNTGIAMYYKGAWHRAGGTSLGAPAWAAIWSLVRQDGQKTGKTVGAAPALLYRIGNSPAYGQAFHDITSGSNGRYRAGIGWDAVTGWGTPDVGGLAVAVLSLAPAASSTSGAR